MMKTLPGTGKRLIFPANLGLFGKVDCLKRRIVARALRA